MADLTACAEFFGSSGIQPAVHLGEARRHEIPIAPPAYGFGNLCGQGRDVHGLVDIDHATGRETRRVRGRHHLAVGAAQDQWSIFDVKSLE